MKTLKKVLLALAVLVAVLLLVGLLLPASYRVERSIVIRAKPDAVFAKVNTLKHWPEWTAWTVARFPDMKLSFSGPDAGEGAVYSWTGKTSGDGTLKITKSEPGKLITYDLDFEHGKYLSKGELSFVAEGEMVAVKLANAGDLGANPVNRWFGLLMDRMMGPDLQAGLDNLKRQMEAPKP
jgi:hypothetical protein